ncbi:MAG TPA: tRNA (guanosine(37)-N1)-methyltransferase TrmD [Kiritimatiellae bacterium]|nr:tRNA (guanosine(37)-N1)-methyltransferase TrmD [Kiritimatiellia bacterium]
MRPPGTADVGTIPLRIEVITIFPSMLEGFLGESIIRRAQDAGLVQIHLVNLRDFTTDRHRTTDDRPYGGGPGMVMKPEPIFRAVEKVSSPGCRIILTTPQGGQFTQQMALQLSRERHLVFICGHYEGVDERVRQVLVTDEISIGDYILTNGALAAAVVIDAVVRLLPGALGARQGTADESFSSGLLEYPQYTRPAEFRGMRVPEVLLSGDHQAVERWRREQALKRTAERRPDLIRNRNSIPDVQSRGKHC